MLPQRDGENAVSDDTSDWELRFCHLHANCTEQLAAKNTEIMALRVILQERRKAYRVARQAIVDARAELEKGRALWNGPCHQCAAVLDRALGAPAPEKAVDVASTHKKN